VSNLYRELTAREKQAIRRLVISECANYDQVYGCLPLDGACYMFTIAFAGSPLCKWFQNAVLPLDLALEAVFSRKPLKACKRCGRKFPVNGRQAYCEACAVPARKAAAAARVRKHRGRDVTL
jgi:ribosomal protein L37E